MTLSRPTRLLVFATICLLLGGAPALARAQHGGGPPGGGGGGMGAPTGSGGGFGGGHMGGGEPIGSLGGYRGPNANEGQPIIRSGPQLAPTGGGRFWDDRKTVKSLKLSSDQQHRMDGIFNANTGTLVNLYSNLQREEQRLSSMPPQDLQDETKVFAAIDRVAQARADLAKAQAHVLIQIRKELDAEQLARLDHEISDSR